MKIKIVKAVVVLCMMAVVGSGIVWGAAGDLVWKYKMDNRVEFSTPAIDNDGTIYIATMMEFDNNQAGGYLYAIYSDGTLKWRYWFDYGIRWSSPAINFDGTIYIGCQDQNLYALNPDGSLKWKYHTSGSIDSSPAIGNDGSVYIANSSGDIYSISKNGGLNWKYQTGDFIHHPSPVIDNDGNIYIGTGDPWSANSGGNIYALNKDGTLLWKYDTEGGVGSSAPSIGSDGTILVGAADRYLYALNKDGSLKWKYLSGWSIQATPVIDANGTIYVSSSNTYALDSDGTLKWKSSQGGTSNSPVLGSDGSIYILRGNNDLYCYSSNGTVKFEEEIDEDVIFMSSPVIDDNGYLYFGGEDGYLYAIDTGTNAGLADSPWPKFQCNNKNTGRKSEMYFAEIPGGTVDGEYVEPFQMGITEVTNQQYADFLNEALAEGKIRVDGNIVYGKEGIFTQQILVNLNDTYIYYHVGDSYDLTRHTFFNKIEFDSNRFIVKSDYENWPAIVHWFGACAYTYANGYNLPSFNQLKIANQGGMNYQYGTNNGLISIDNANFNDNIGHYVGVGSYPPNPFGLYDLAGNASEHADNVDNRYGGDFFSSSTECKIDHHFKTGDHAGFRVVSLPVSPQIIFPNGGEIFTSGNTLDIMWKYKNESISIEYSTNNGIYWSTIDTDIAGELGIYYWKIPQAESDQCLIKITDSSNESISSISESTFKIIPNTEYRIHDIPIVALTENSFSMGSTEHGPIHSVSLNALQISRYEITQKQYLSIMGSNPSQNTSSEDLPVTHVSWYSAVQFCNKLSEIAGFDPCYNESTWECNFDKNGFRLPTEAEWEYACGAGDYGNNGIGEDNFSDYAWFEETSIGVIHAVGQKKPNHWNLYDMHGNVAEWCTDWFEENYSVNNSEFNPVGPDTGTSKVRRGGAINEYSRYLLSYFRHDNPPDWQMNNNGFRIVRRDSRAIQGKILNNGSPLSAVNIHITGAITDTTVTTDDTGTYTLAGWLGGEYTVTPRKVGYTFSPDSTTVSIDFEDVTVDEFQAELDPRYVMEHGIPFAKIPAGSFMMGSEESALEFENLVHEVTLDGFFIGATEVTQEQYLDIIGENISRYTDNVNNPVDKANWYESVQFCNKLSELLGLEKCYNESTWECDITKNGYRLPTEAEWEYACRAGTSTKYYNGSTESDLDKIAWYKDNCNNSPQPVGLKSPNSWNLYDIYGNVW
ncbi:SUMF1/EgtB/PvdO family nonheme iron enzyme, partial [Candidatus Latescibacterota bacterium]